MTEFEPGRTGALSRALEFQSSILDGVSRTFALTIPSLPEGLRVPVTNAYLLCRIADTLEDDSSLELDRKRRYARQFVRVLEQKHSGKRFAADLAPRLGPETLDDERTLVARADEVVRITHSFAPETQHALLRCVSLMSDGMHRFQRRAGPAGLRNLGQLDEYCYFVAGVVGEMLTELFCQYHSRIQRNRDRMMKLAPSFGQGLQMTNILKDIWDDRGRGVCWLPRAEFGLDPDGTDDLIDALPDQSFQNGLRRMTVVAHQHLRNALEYTLLIPPEFSGIRRFCLWALGMAVPTLVNLYQRPDFRHGDEVKISRADVRRIVRRYGLCARRDVLLRWLFRRASASLPNSDPAMLEQLQHISRAAAEQFSATHDHDSMPRSAGTG